MKRLDFLKMKAFLTLIPGLWRSAVRVLIIICDGNIDEDCGGCTDGDGDGWCIEDGDCEDNNSHVYPGHPDRGGRWDRDGIDNDCNGVEDG